MEFEQVRQSYQRCASLGDEFFDSFYANLVDQETAIGQMFAETDMQKQNELIEDGIAQLIHFAEGSKDAETRIRALGQSHSQHFLNVLPDYYSLWLDSLMLAVKEHDPNYTPELEAHWREVAAPGIELMVSLY